MEKKLYILALVFGLTSIILGAFGAHWLKKHLSIDQLNSFEVGVRYQMYHALFLLFVAQSNAFTFKTKNELFYLTLVGVILFSGSIYLLSTSKLTSLNTRVLGPLTPIGGLVLICSWGYLLFQILQKK